MRRLRRVRQLVHAQWPTGDAPWRASEVEPPGRDHAAVVRGDPRDSRALPGAAEATGRVLRIQPMAKPPRCSRGPPLLAHMAGLSDVTIAADAQRTKDRRCRARRSKAFLLGVVDLEKEKAKLQKQAEKLRGQIGGIEKKLGNEGFVAKAPPQVIEKERRA
jgi:valyl-tRNA synthetase